MPTVISDDVEGEEVNVGTTVPGSKPRGSTPWLTIARAEDGTRETPGPRHNPRVVNYFADIRHAEIKDDETAWCAAFVGSCLERVGYRSTRSTMAKSYRSWGKPCQPKMGAIMIFDRGADKRFGHVGFYVGEDHSSYFILGGNQKNAVNVTRVPKRTFVEARWPVTLLNSRTVQGGATSATGTALNTGAELIPDPVPAAPVTDAGSTIQQSGETLQQLGHIKWWLAAIGTVLIVAGVAWMLYARWDDYQNKGR